MESLADFDGEDRVTLPIEQGGEELHATREAHGALPRLSSFT